jgi:hypothetical protein
MNLSNGFISNAASYVDVFFARSTENVNRAEKVTA